MATRMAAWERTLSKASYNAYEAEKLLRDYQRRRDLVDGADSLRMAAQRLIAARSLHEQAYEQRNRALQRAILAKP